MMDIDALVPGGVLCMYSAWEHYELTTQIPNAFCIAIPRKRKVVLPEFPPVTLYFWSDHLLDFGIERASVHGHDVRVTDLERSVCDAVKYRNKIGLDVALEALREAWDAKRVTAAELWRCAKANRVANVMLPYCEALQ